MTKRVLTTKTITMKHYLYIVSLVCLLGACKKDVKNLFEALPDDRLQALINTDSTTLVNSEFGWKAALTPGSSGVGAYFFFFDFDASGKVIMVGDFDTTTAKTAGTSTWRMKAIQNPALLFDTYNYIHRLSDPDTAISHGTTVGKGLYTDFEFYFQTVSNDSLRLKGTRNSSTLLLTRATKAEYDAYTSGALKNMIETTIKYVNANSYLYIQFPDGKKIPFGLSVRNKSIVMQYVNAGNAIVNTSSTFYFTQNSLHLMNAITYNGYTFQDVYYDDVAKVYYIMVNNTRLNVVSANTASTLPLTPELYTLLGGKYTDIYVNPATQAGLPASFNILWADCKTRLAAVGSAGRIADWVDVLFPSATQAQLRFRYRNTAGSPFFATYTYTMTIDPATKAATFTFVTQDGNGSVVAAGFKPFTDYFANNKFTFSYVANTASTTMLGGLFNVADPTSFFFGELK